MVKHNELIASNKLVFNNMTQLKKGIKPRMLVKSDNKMRSTIVTREVTRVNTVSILTKMVPGEFMGVDNRTFHTDFGKAKDAVFNLNGDIDYLAHVVTDKYGATYMFPSPDFKEGDTWLTLSIYE